MILLDISWEELHIKNKTFETLNKQIVHSKTIWNPWLNWIKVLEMVLTHFMPVVSFDTPWKHQKSKGFVMLSGGIERDSGMKCVKEGLAVLSQSLLKLTPQQIPHSPSLLWSDSTNVTGYSTTVTLYPFILRPPKWDSLFYRRIKLLFCFFKRLLRTSYSIFKSIWANYYSP